MSEIGGSNYAYVDGAFQIELPVGEVYVEATRGFEYEPLRQKLNIAAGQRELRLEPKRAIDLRARGWATADTHVHFLSPHTALLEARAEGLNLIHLLATQWGDLFTNVGDYTGHPFASDDGEAMVYVATENRQHMLGHIGLLGYGGDQPIQPLTTAGPNESYLGDPTWISLASGPRNAANAMVSPSPSTSPTRAVSCRPTSCSASSMRSNCATTAASMG